MSTPFNEEAKEEEKKEQAEVPTTENTEAPSTEETPESAQDINWKQFREERKKERERLEQAERERQEKEKQMEAMQQVMQQYLGGQQGQQQAPQWEDDEDEDKKLERKIAEYEKKKEEERKRQEKEQLPQYLRQAHQDFDQVVNQDNVDYFEYHYPEVASAFAHMPESYEKWDKIYKAVKKFVPNQKKEMEQKAEKNLSKPQSPNIEGMTQTSDSAPHILDEEKRKANWRRMRQSMKSV